MYSDDNTERKNGPSPEGGVTESTQILCSTTVVHTTGIVDHLLCTDAIQGPENMAVDETEESLLSWSYIPAGETNRKTRHNREITWRVRRGSVSRRKDQVGQGKGKRGRGAGVRGLTEAARGKSI